MSEAEKIELDDKQEEIVFYPGEKPLSVEAGPGAGKTRVIIERVKYLLNEKKVAPESMLIITFTRKAAEELKYSASDIGVAERHIRRCVSDGKIGFISIGNRCYIAMQSFMPPYSESLIYGESEARAKQQRIKNDIMEQLNAKLSSSTAMPIVQRKKKRSGWE